jgi:hypothetical protein
MRATRAVPALTALAAAAASALGLAACGASAGDQVKAKVQQFARATESHNYLTICHDVLAPSLLADLVRGGIGCEQALQISLGTVKSPRLTIGPVKVNGNAASVLTISQAKGEKTLLTSLGLVNTARGWRISSLGAPVH